MKIIGKELELVTLGTFSAERATAEPYSELFKTHLTVFNGCRPYHLPHSGSHLVPTSSLTGSATTKLAKQPEECQGRQKNIRTDGGQT